LNVGYLLGLTIRFFCGRLNFDWQHWIQNTKYKLAPYLPGAELIAKWGELTVTWYQFASPGSWVSWSTRGASWLVGWVDIGASWLLGWNDSGANWL